ncbi:hypothetical protein BGZ61DRAFT_345516, partial [Ilyonectria robusta]|uniref:uncharacterized protein n=1 Tax=Ilyonectria robusta TaxID=1079257 RepID=UPI001E8CAF06
YGYTFVSKGTVRAFIHDLEHEAAVYERLWPIQGVNVTVFSGASGIHAHWPDCCRGCTWEQGTDLTHY